MTRPLPYEQLRRMMVEDQIAARGVSDPLVLKAMNTVPREDFVPADLRDMAYLDQPLPVGEGQTISQPYMVALMTQAARLTPDADVLEIGTGSGYAAAVLGEIAKTVYTIERIKPLADTATAALKRTGYTNVHVIHDDGTKGLPAHAPYDAIIVTAGGPDVPPSLKHQLKIGGRLVLPVGEHETFQRLLRITRMAENHFEEEFLCSVRFVPLIGEEGWNERTLAENHDPGIAGL